MNVAPLLQQLVEIAGGGGERGYILALRPEGVDGLPEEVQTGGYTYQVRAPETELALRRELWRSGGAPFIAFLAQPLAERLPPDLLRRARSAKIHTLDPLDVLSAGLGVQVIGIEDPDVVQLAIEHLDTLRSRLAQGRETLPTAVDAELLDELLIGALLDIRLRGGSAAAVLARLVQDGLPEDPRVSALLQRRLPQRFGTEGRLLAWALDAEGRPRALLVHGLLLAIESEELPQAAWGPLYEAGQSEAFGVSLGVLRTTADRLSGGALDALPAGAQAILQESESIANQFLPSSVLARSTLLPLGLRTRCAELAARAQGGQAITIEETRWLRAHRAADSHKHDIALIEDLARLSRYLATPQPPLPGSVSQQLRRYQESGAFADVAAQRLQRSMAATGNFHAEAKSVLKAWRQRRNAENRRFAETLAEDYTAAIHGADVIPMQRIWTQAVNPRLAEAAQAGVFVLVMDGCSYPVFIELVQQLAGAGEQTIGVAWSDETEAFGLPGLAILPSVTSHSRGALILGQIPDDPLVEELSWRSEKEAKTDPARFKQNQALGSRSRALFLKGGLSMDGGAELRQTLADPAIEVVCAIFNAVDDQIGSGNTGMPLELRADRIAGLLPALRTAFDAGRSVLLTADHGHSLFFSKDLRAGTGSAPRYTHIAKHEEPPEGFQRIDLAGIGGKTNANAFAWKMGVYLGNQPQVGFHGGCSLEELVVPMAWLRRDGVPVDEPAWWLGSDAHAARTPKDAAPRAAPPREPAAAPAPAPASSAQAALPLSADLDPEATGLSEDRLAALDPDERRALGILRQNGTATVTELARALGMRRGRVSGFMRELQRDLASTDDERFRAETLDSGETQYVFLRRKGDA